MFCVSFVTPVMLINKLILVTFWVAFTNVAAASSNFPTPEALAYSPTWLKMLHYEHRLFGGYRSRMAGKEFFFAPEGQTNPLAELNATVAAFDQDLKVGKLKQHPQCAFPLRLKFLKEQLHLTVKPVPCEALDQFVDSFKAKSASIVFSTAYPNNPGSMFGHTFLKFNSGARSGLLDQAISYAANINEDGGIIYMIRGVFGGYKGVFSRTPYYVKVNEYNHAESRDLWEYQLDLTPDEATRLVLHLWEIEVNSSFDYYFFDENCSYVLLAAIEAAKPQWELTRNWLYVIPGETVKEIDRIPAAFGKSQFRPSLRKKFFQAYDGLSPEEQAALRALVDQRSSPAETHNAAVLDVTSLYFQYTKQRDGDDVNPLDLERQKETLLARSELKGQVGLSDRVLPPLDMTNDPREGHASKRLHFAMGNNSQGNYGELGVKLAFHDLLDRDAGYEHFSHFDFPFVTARYFAQDRSFQLEHFNVVAVTSLFPWTVLEQRWSWKFALDYRAIEDLPALGHHALHLDGGPGISLLLSKGWVFSSFVGFQVEGGNAFENKLRGGPRVDFQSLMDLGGHWKVKLNTAPTFDLFQSERTGIYLDNELSAAFAPHSRYSVQLVGRNWTRVTTHHNDFQLKFLTYF